MVFATDGVSCIPSLMIVPETPQSRGSLVGVMTCSAPWFNSDWVIVLRLLASAARYAARLYCLLYSFSFILEFKILKFKLIYFTIEVDNLILHKKSSVPSWSHKIVLTCLVFTDSKKRRS